MEAPAGVIPGKPFRFLARGLLRKMFDSRASASLIPNHPKSSHVLSLLWEIRVITVVF
jgi:hypothetical protein